VRFASTVVATVMWQKLQLLAPKQNCVTSLSYLNGSFHGAAMEIVDFFTIINQLLPSIHVPYLGLLLKRRYLIVLAILDFFS